MAEKGRRWSPYTYAFNDPIRFVDPDGMWPTPKPAFAPLIPFLVAAGEAVATYFTAEVVVGVAVVATTAYIGTKAYNHYKSRSGLENTWADQNYSPIVKRDEAKSADKKGDTPENPEATSRAARRGAMRKAGVPTSQPLHKDKDTKSEDAVLLDRDGNNVVQDAKNDESHQGQPHWEAGKTKKDDGKPDGINRSGGSSNKPQMQNEGKGKSYYEPKPKHI